MKPITMFATAALLAIGVALPVSEGIAQANDGVVMNSAPPVQMLRADRIQSSNPQQSGAASQWQTRTQAPAQSQWEGRYQMQMRTQRDATNHFQVNSNRTFSLRRQ